MNKEIIFEELTKMRNLMTAKAGVVISEQALDVAGDVGRIMRQLNAGNTNETDVVNTIKKYKTKQDFQNFLNQYEKIVGRKFGEHLRTALDPSADSKEWNDLKNHLSTMGITLSKLYNVKDDNTTFVGLNQPAAAGATPATGERQNNISTTYCKLVNGKIVSTNNLNGMDWPIYKSIYNVTPQEEQIAMKSCPKTKVGGQSGVKSKQGPSIQNRFAQSASSLGIKNAKMTPETLQSILTTLEGGNPAPKQ